MEKKQTFIFSVTAKKVQAYQYPATNTEILRWLIMQLI